MSIGWRYCSRDDDSCHDLPPKFADTNQSAKDSKNGVPVQTVENMVEHKGENLDRERAYWDQRKCIPVPASLGDASFSFKVTISLRAGNSPSRKRRLVAFLANRLASDGKMTPNLGEIC